MARKFHIIERKDTDADVVRSKELHNIANAYRYQHGLASEFDALYELLLKKQGKEKEEREEKKTGQGGVERVEVDRGGWSGAAD